MKFKSIGRNEPYKKNQNFVSRSNDHRILLCILCAALALRLLTLSLFWGQPLTIVDEQHYQEIAANILHDGQFAYQAGQPTAIRPPAYPFFLYFVYKVSGRMDFNIVRLCQVTISLLTVLLVYLLGKRMFDPQTGLLAAAIFACYPSFFFFTNFILTETLFTLLAVLFVFLLHASHKIPVRAVAEPGGESQKPVNALTLKRQLVLLLAAGLVGGVAALTRSIFYPFLALCAGFLFLTRPQSLVHRLSIVLVFSLGITVVIGPWALRNYRLFHQFVPVGTMGGLNLYMGNYSHTPLNRAWAAVDNQGNKAWYAGHEEVLKNKNEAEKQKWAIGQARRYMTSHKLLTAKRVIIKAMNFWGLERAVIAPMQKGHWPQLKNIWCIAPIAVAILSVFSFTILSSIFGLTCTFTIRRHDFVFIVLILVYFTAMHAIVFGHPRYHLPLMPFLAIFSAWAVLNRSKIWETRQQWRFKLAGTVAGIFVCIWIRDIIIEGLRALGAV
jgi:4-amino-4-deoxy-L-arabinose transferase-like glycosyltransferase